MVTRTNQIAGVPGYMVNAGAADLGPGRQIDWESVPDTYAGRDAVDYTITVSDATAAQGDTDLGVAALPVALPVGTLLDFGEHTSGWQQYARLSAAADAGDTSLTVYPLSGAIEDAATATYTSTEAGGGNNAKQIPGGTIMCALASGKMVPVAAAPGAETAIGLLVGDAVEDEPQAALSGYGLYIGGAVYENLLPDYGATDFATWKTELNAAGVGHFTWHTYADSTGS